MPRRTAAAEQIIRDLGDGLVLRRSVPADRDALVAFNCGIHCRSEHDDPPEVIARWIRDLMSGDHPTFSPGDFTIVEDTRTGEIVSSLNLISQTWRYAGLPLAVGRPELVGTKEAYRRKGLIRAQFDVIHDWSAQRGEMLQFITGIPFFYRQFGYEMTVAMPGSRGLKSAVPKLKKGEQEPCRLRPAVEADLPFIARTYESGMSRNLLSAVRDKALWRYELTGRRKGSMPHWKLAVIEDRNGRRLGFLAHGSRLWRGALTSIACELKHGASWLEATPCVLRYLAATGEKLSRRTKASFEWIGFEAAHYHPLKRVIPSFFRGGGSDSYAYYIRVPDLPRFLRHISPVLEDRLARSPAARYTGELKLSFYRDGLRLAFKRGRLIASAPWKPDDRPSAVFPYLTFLHLVFGHRSLDEIRNIFPDSGAWGDTPHLLLETLFPKLPSEIWGIE